MVPMPAMWWSVPVNSIARVGEQAGAEWKSVNRMPAWASRSRLGVLISPPNAPISENPRSSATITREVGPLHAEASCQVRPRNGMSEK